MTKRKLPRSTVHLLLNGTSTTVGSEFAHLNLGAYLREQRRLTGTKLVCSEGDCGACTVLIANAHSKEKIPFKAINSCIFPVTSADGCSVITVEGLSQVATSKSLTEVQKKLVESTGTQCGYCTPGFVMTLTGYLQEPESQKSCSLQEALVGNLCRCTGYLPIIEGAKKIDPKKNPNLRQFFFNPQQLKLLKLATQDPLEIENSNFHYFAPKTVASIKNKITQKTTLVSGNTDLGVLVNKDKLEITRAISLNQLTSAKKISKKPNSITIGHGVTITEFESIIKKQIPELFQFLKRFASPQIKNSATVIGNIANASPIGDLPPALLALDASLTFRNLKTNKARKLQLSAFFIGYKKTALKPFEMIESIEIPIAKNSIFRIFKASQRRDLDISTVSAALLYKKKTLRFAMGGVREKPIRLLKTELLLNQLDIPKMTEPEISRSCQVLLSEITPLSDLRGGAEYRKTVATNWFKSFLHELATLARGHQQ